MRSQAQRDSDEAWANDTGYNPKNSKYVFEINNKLWYDDQQIIIINKDRKRLIGEFYD